MFDTGIRRLGKIITPVLVYDYVRSTSIKRKITTVKKPTLIGKQGSELRVEETIIEPSTSSTQSKMDLCTDWLSIKINHIDAESLEAIRIFTE